jgi:hypothetical protein
LGCLPDDVQPGCICQQGQFFHRILERQQVFLTAQFDSNQKYPLAWGYRGFCIPF